LETDKREFIGVCVCMLERWKESDEIKKKRERDGPRCSAAQRRPLCTRERRRSARGRGNGKGVPVDEQTTGALKF